MLTSARTRLNQRKGEAIHIGMCVAKEWPPETLKFDAHFGAWGTLMTSRGSLAMGKC